MNLLYLTPKKYNTRRFAGGMGTKTKSINAAWSHDHHIDIVSEIDTELINFYDVILIELLGFRRKKDFEERIEILKNTDVPKIVYGSDSEIFRWTGKELAMLNEVVSLWIPNMKWQGNYFRDFGLAVTDVVYEPIDTHLFRPSADREKVIVAGGAISYEKQSEFFVKLFERLKPIKKDYETEYLGSADLWQQPPKVVDLELEHDLKAVVDVFHGAVPQSDVASTIGRSAVGVLNPKYETCNRFDMELMAGGVGRVCGPHTCYDERPTDARFETIDECIEHLSVLTDDFTALPDKALGVAARDYAVANFSYEASLSQLNDILRRVL